MPKTKISEFSATPGNNTDIDGINIAEGCAPSGINDAIRELMAQLKDFQAGTAGDSFNGPVGTSTAAAGAFTTLSATGVATFSSGTAGAPAITTTGDTNTGIFFPAADTVAAATGGTERLRLDSSGNLGLGVTPSAWSGFGKTMEFNNAGCYVGNSGATSMQVGANNYFNGSNYIYSTSNVATRYAQSSGQHLWFTAPSGTAGTAITFTQAMTLDASGNLGIGTTSPGTILDIQSASAIAKLTSTTGTNGVTYRTVNTGGTSYFGRDSSSGGFGAAYATVVWGTGAYPMLFGTNDIERARITSGGYLLVGTSSAAGDARLVVNNPDNVSGDFCFITYLGSNCSDTSSYHYIASTGGADKFYLYGNGNVVNTNGSYGTLSDVKLKENIVDATPKLADVMRLQVRNFNLKTEPGHKQIGFVAQEFEQVFPAMVDESPDRDEEGNQLETTTKHIKTSVLVPILVKAIQEQQAMIQQLQAEVAALKGN